MVQGAAIAAVRNDPELVAYAQQLCNERLAAYRAAPHDAEEHANIETSVLAGGYAYRQVAELIQNAADAIADIGASAGTGRIIVETDSRGLWCANTGVPVDAAGVRALLNSHASGKRAGQIGRFGLGFKSLLRLGGQIDVLSRSVCLHFDPARSRNLIRTHLRLAADAPAPGLRLADPGTWEEEVATAPGAERFADASTIVFAELVSTGAREAVAEEIRQFPAEFLLFLPCDVELVLRAADVNRHLRRRTGSDGHVVIEDVANEKLPAQRWRIFETSVRVSDEAALADATSVHARDQVPLIWATPVGGAREAAGRFYAFFPTTTETRTLGILNAPWKLNSDRTAVIPGAWNAALMRAAADLIVDKLPELGTDEDPGAVLDAFPRELTTLSEPAAPLVNALWARLLDAPVLPNCDAEPACPADLRRAPSENSELIAAWASLAEPELCAQYLHASCTVSTARQGRLRNLADRLAAAAKTDERPRLKTAGAAEWLEQACSSDEDTAGESLRLADRYATLVPGWQWEQIRDSVRVILTAGGHLAAAPEVTLATPADPPLQSVHPVLRADPDLRQILHQRFNVEEGEDTDWERLLDVWIERAVTDDDWTGVWKLLRRMPWDEFTEQVAQRDICVSTLSGWHSAGAVIRPGELISISDLAGIGQEGVGRELRTMLLDETFHAEDATWLTELGVSGLPQLSWSSAYVPEYSETVSSDWLHRWRARCVSNYHDLLSNRPDRSRLGPARLEMPAAWQLLLLAPVSRRGPVTTQFLRALLTAGTKAAPVLFHHATRPGTWKTHTFLHPVFEALLGFGALANQSEHIALSELTLPQTPALADLIPSLQPLQQELDTVRAAVSESGKSASEAEAWKLALLFAAGESKEPQELAALWNRAAEAGHVPERVCTSTGPAAISNVRIATSLREIAFAREAGLAAVCLTPSAAALWLKAGARPLAQDARLEWITDAEEPQNVLLLDLEPALRDVLKPHFAATASATIMELIEQQIGQHRNFIDWNLSDGRLLISQEALGRGGWTERTALLIDAATAAGWIACDDALEKVLTSGVSAHRRVVAAESDLPARLLRATGGAKHLAALFESDVQMMLAEDPHRLAEVALTLFGPALLTMAPITSAMREQGLHPPERWGTEAAADFVAAIGFTPEYAASPAQRREAELAISGPLPLKPLHDFQEDVVASLKGLFADTKSRRRRAVISLPTGAGKTRVAAETAVREVLALENDNRLVLWIAQSDELCEQAVQCFRELWTNIGAVGETLRLIRFWGGQLNPTPAARDEPAVIVASIQTLTSRMNDPTLSWASQPGLIVIDECHHALTPAYSGMLRWFGPNRETEEREPPIVGLSATPFRGRSDEETQKLAKRFDNRLIPHQQGHLFDMLQERGVLARIQYTCLKMDDRFVLTDEEERHLGKFQQLNDTALKRLGENAERNDRILEEVAAAKERSTLIFATSVAHAQRLAARLNVMGVSAATVTGETDRASRRWFIRGFQRGDIRVLCNHSALTTGFDAPATDLIVIARPVFSPALYMQMVGRGLRGPANGGKDCCRILTIQDNLDAYTGKLAHHYFVQHYVSNCAISDSV